MKIKNNLGILLFAIVTVATYISCGADTSPKEEPVIAPIIEIPKVNKVNLYLENSASMKGYLNGGTEFTDNVDDIVTKLNSSNAFRDNVYAHTICDEVYNYDNLTDFQSALRLKAGQSISIGKSSKLDQIIKTVFENTKTDEISLLVTDGIMSGSDLELKEYLKKYKKHFNQEQKNALKNEIFKVVDEYKQEYFVKVMLFKSSFEGTYYKLDNSKLGGSFASRPYYVICVGGKDVYQDFEEKTNGIFNFTESADFGIGYKSVKATPTVYSRKSQNVVIHPKTLAINVKYQKEDIAFPLFINLQSLPAHYSNDSLLQKEMRLLVNGVEGAFETKIFSKENWDEVLRKGGSELDQQKKENTHLVLLSSKSYKINPKDGWDLVIKDSPVVWIEKYSCDNDLEINFDFHQTLNLDYLIKGFQEVHHSDHIFSQPIKFKL